MGRRLVGGVLVALGLIAASMAWAGFSLTRTILDPDRSEAFAEELYQDREVRAQLRDSMADALAAAVPEGVQVPRAQLVEAADTALDDPLVEDLLVGGLVRSHQRFLGEDPNPDEPIVIDGAALASASRVALVNARPELANVVPEAPSLAVTLPTERIPDAGGFRTWLLGIVGLLAAVAAGLVVAAFVLTNDRPRVLRRVGFWAIGAAAFWLIVGVVLPELAHLLIPGTAAIFGATVGVAAGGMIPPSINALIAGVAAVVLSLVWMAVAAMMGRPARPARQARPEPARPVAAPPRPAPVGASMPSPPPGPPRAPAPPPRPAPSDPTTVTAPAPPAPARTAAPPAATSPPPPPTSAPRWVEGVGYVSDDEAGGG